MEEYDYEGMDQGSGILATLGAGVILFYLLLLVIIIASLWKIFVKAGKPGWAAIIPIYNIIVWLEIVGKPVWWIILLIIPIVNFLVAIYLYHLTAKAFGKDIVMTLLLIFLPFIGFPILGFGDAQYVGPPKD